MARADLLKDLFRSFRLGDDEAFRAAAERVIREERRKHHVVVANELERILENGTASDPWPAFTKLAPPPIDPERQAALLEVRKPKRFLSEVVLDPAVRRLIANVVEELRDWDVLEAHGLRPSSRLLFCGPSGCGKTITAEALAQELDLPLIYVRFDAVVSSLLGETAANLRKVFDYASHGQWLLFFDEFDAIGRSRDDATEHGEIKRVVNTFLQILDGFEGRSVVIAATNFERALDPAIWRRFDEVVHFGLPTREQIEALILRWFKRETLPERVVKLLVRELTGGTFADVERVAMDLRKRQVMAASREVSEVDIRSAVRKHRARKAVLEGLRAPAEPLTAAPALRRADGDPPE